MPAPPPVSASGQPNPLGLFSLTVSNGSTTGAGTTQFNPGDVPAPPLYGQGTAAATDYTQTDFGGTSVGSQQRDLWMRGGRPGPLNQFLPAPLNQVLPVQPSANRLPSPTIGPTGELQGPFRQRILDLLANEMGDTRMSGGEGSGAMGAGVGGWGNRMQSMSRGGEMQPSPYAILARTRAVQGTLGRSGGNVRPSPNGPVVPNTALSTSSMRVPSSKLQFGQPSIRGMGSE